MQDSEKEWNNKRSRLKTIAGLYLYRVLRNDLSWNLLGPREQEWVYRANEIQNLERAGYSDPENYGGGKTFDAKGSRQRDAKGLFLTEYLDTHQPNSVLEIGPGSGFYTRAICEHPAVSQYFGLDINPSFTSYLEQKLKTIKKDSFKYKFFSGDFHKLNWPSVDSIIFLSAVHHIPNRIELFSKAQRALNKRGTIFLWEPTHYLPRLKLITQKFLKGFYDKEYRENITSLATHNFCTIEEFEKVFKKVENLGIESCSFLRIEAPPLFPKKVFRALLHYLNLPRSPENWFIAHGHRNIFRFFSNRISIVSIKQASN